mgnify:CR=1 FL=1
MDAPLGTCLDSPLDFQNLREDNIAFQVLKITLTNCNPALLESAELLNASACDTSYAYIDGSSPAPIGQCNEGTVYYCRASRAT